MRTRLPLLFCLFTLLLPARAQDQEQDRPINPLITDRLAGPKAITEQLRLISNLLNDDSRLDEALELTRSVLKAGDATEIQKAHAHYARAVLLLKKSEWDAALDDFTIVAGSKVVPAELKALAHWGEARVHIERKRNDAALKSLNAAIDLPDSPGRITAKILDTRATLFDRMGRTREATEDYKLIADQKELAPAVRGRALLRRAEAYEEAGDLVRSIADCSTVIDLKPAPSFEMVAIAHINRSHHYLALGQVEKAETDATFVLEHKPAASPQQRLLAFINRAGTRDKAGNASGAISDYRDILQIPNVPANEAAMARTHLGALLMKTGKVEEGQEILASVIGEKSTPASVVGFASVTRGAIFAQTGKPDQAIEDFNRALLNSATPTEQRAMAYLNRGTVYLQTGRREQAMKDFETVTQDPSLSPNHRAMAWHKTAEVHRDDKKIEDAVKDISNGLAIPGISSPQKTVMLRQRVLLRESQSQYEEAIADMNEVIRLPRPLENQVLDLLYRAKLHGKAKRYNEMVADLSAVIETKNAPVRFVSEALRLRGEIYKAAGQNEKAAADHLRREKLPSS